MDLKWKIPDLSQVTMYDIKNLYNQAKNVVLNVSEIEAKVQLATNEDPWGASSTLMQEIAHGTFNFQQFNEIMPAIYSRFMEKEARQWRQIYKALQLLEYLVKNGSERVVDDARSHIGTIKMLRNFYYVDEKGKDQGINVRNRSKEIVELLGDVDKIRTERRKAKANRGKYAGAGNDSAGGRYGGFGGGSNYDTYGDRGGGYGGSSVGRYGDSRFPEYDAGDDDHAPRRFHSAAGRGGGYGGSSAERYGDSSSRFQEYDAGDAGTTSSAHTSTPQRASTLPPAAAPVPPKPKQPEVDLLGMDDDTFGSSVPAPMDKALPALNRPVSHAGGDDDFDDFQSAPTSAVPTSNVTFLNPTASTPVVPTSLPPPLAAQPVASLPQTSVRSQAPTLSTSNNLFGAVSATATYMSPPAVQNNAMRPMMASPPPNTPPVMMGAPLVPNQSFMTPMSPPGRTSTISPGIAPPQKSTADFGDLWSLSLGSAPVAGATPQKSMKDLEKEKTQAQMWGNGQNRPPMAAGFGSFAGAPAASTANAAPPSSTENGLDDLLF